MSASMLPNTPISLMNGESSTLKALCEGKRGVLDLWHTKCTRCPAALEKLNEEAGNHPEFLYIAGALSLGVGNKDTVAELISDWENLTHIFIEESDKDELKGSFGYTSVPFYIVFDKEGNIVKMGEPKSMDLLATLKSIESSSSSDGQVSAPQPAPTMGALVLDEDF